MNIDDELEQNGSRNIRCADEIAYLPAGDESKVAWGIVALGYYVMSNQLYF
jgi:hypothetical protein